MRRAAKVANLAVHQRHNRLLLRVRHLTIFQTVALFRNDKRHRHLPFQRIFHPNHRHFGNARMTGDTLFNLTRTQPMSGNVNHIVSAPENKVITVSIADAPVKSGVHRTGKQRPVRLHKAVVVAPDGLNTAWRQWPLHYQHPFLIDATRFAGDFIEQLHVIAIHRHAGASQTRRPVVQTASNRHNRPAGFGLPVVVDDRHIQRIAHPTGGRLVQRFSSQIEHFQRRKIVFANFSGREFFQHANGGRR